MRYFNYIMNEKPVRETASDAAASKYSARSKGYFADPYIECFVKNPRPRAPLINRGYYSRVAAIRQLVEGFLACDQSCKLEQCCADSGGGVAISGVQPSLPVTFAKGAIPRVPKRPAPCPPPPPFTTASAADAEAAQTKQIISLGAGQDTIFFNLKVRYHYTATQFFLFVTLPVDRTLALSPTLTLNWISQKSRSTRSLFCSCVRYR